MDPEIYAQRSRERDELRREHESSARNRRDERQESDQEAHQLELAVGEQRGWRGGWGTSSTWWWILFFVLVLVIPWLMSIFLVGSRSAAPQEWHLGFPPTGPG